MCAAANWLRSNPVATAFGSAHEAEDASSLMNAQHLTLGPEDVTLSSPESPQVRVLQNRVFLKGAAAEA